MQMLVELPATAAGFEYCWLPYEQVFAKLRRTLISTVTGKCFKASRYIDKDFAPVHLSHVAPCVIHIDTFELLGNE